MWQFQIVPRKINNCFVMTWIDVKASKEVENVKACLFVQSDKWFYGLKGLSARGEAANAWSIQSENICGLWGVRERIRAACVEMAFQFSSFHQYFVWLYLHKSAQKESVFSLLSLTPPPCGGPLIIHRASLYPHASSGTFRIRCNIFILFFLLLSNTYSI